MTEAFHQIARHPMVVDHKNMTITVGSRVFDKPDLHRRPEFDFDFKGEICGYPETTRETKTWNKFYSAMLGCKFNWRFFGTNYGLWIAGKMTPRTGNMLTYEGKNWKRYNTELVRRAHTVLPYINEAERDGLYNLIPVIIAHGAAPQAIRTTIGRGAWRRVANNSVTRNKLIMNAAMRCADDKRAAAFCRMLEIPSGLLRWVNGATDDEIHAARITPRKRMAEFQQTLHTVSDTRAMMLPDEFNPQWGYTRMRQEHELATKAIMERRFSDKKFSPDFEFEATGFKAVLLTSQADIAVEGSMQHHCVASYARNAAMGDYAVFRIEGKERATAGLAKSRVDQVYGACNNPVSEACKAFVIKLATAYAKSKATAQ